MKFVVVKFCLLICAISTVIGLVDQSSSQDYVGGLEAVSSAQTIVPMSVISSISAGAASFGSIADGDHSATGTLTMSGSSLSAGWSLTVYSQNSDSPAGPNLYYSKKKPDTHTLAEPLRVKIKDSTGTYTSQLPLTTNPLPILSNQNAVLQLFDLAPIYYQTIDSGDHRSTSQYTTTVYWTLTA